MILKIFGLKIDVRFVKKRIGCIYLTFDNYTYYIDNSTTEQIISIWPSDVNDDLKVSTYTKHNHNK